MLVHGALPKKRFQDNLEVDLSKPDEEDYPLAMLSPYSFFHALFFTRQIRKLFDEQVLFEGASGEKKQGLGKEISSCLLPVNS